MILNFNQKKLTILQAGAGEVILSALAPGTDVAPHCARARGFCWWEGKLGKVLRKGNGVFGCWWVFCWCWLVFSLRCIWGMCWQRKVGEIESIRVVDRESVWHVRFMMLLSIFKINERNLLLSEGGRWHHCHSSMMLETTKKIQEVLPMIVDAITLFNANVRLWHPAYQLPTTHSTISPFSLIIDRSFDV